MTHSARASANRRVIGHLLAHTSRRRDRQVKVAGEIHLEGDGLPNRHGRQAIQEAVEHVGARRPEAGSDALAIGVRSRGVRPTVVRLREPAPGAQRATGRQIWP